MWPFKKRKKEAASVKSETVSVKSAPILNDGGAELEEIEKAPIPPTSETVKYENPFAAARRRARARSEIQK